MIPEDEAGLLDACRRRLLAPLIEGELRLTHFAATAEDSLTDDERRTLQFICDDQQALIVRVKRFFSASAPTDQKAAPPSALTARATTRFRVLVVDDDGAMRESLREMLADHYEVCEAADGQEAAEQFARSRPDVIVTDVEMPVRDGLWLVGAVRASEQGKSTPILLVSGVDDPRVKVHAFEQGAFDYVVKPVSGPELIARVRNALVWSETLKREQSLQMVDELTGLGNRRRFTTFLTESLQHAARSASVLSVVMVDQDNLKRINDTHGHSAGDVALRNLASAMTAAARPEDLIARIGGDEFACVFPNADRAAAEDWVARVKAELSKAPVTLSTGSIDLSASFGVASTSDLPVGEAASELLDRADHALYAEKRAAPDKARVPLRILRWMERALAGGESRGDSRRVS